MAVVLNPNTDLCEMLDFFNRHVYGGCVVNSRAFHPSPKKDVKCLTTLLKYAFPQLHCILLNGPYGDSAAVKLKTQR